jgi:hypothetical protein
MVSLEDFLAALAKVPRPTAAPESEFVTWEARVALPLVGELRCMLPVLSEPPPTLTSPPLCEALDALAHDPEAIESFNLKRASDTEFEHAELDAFVSRWNARFKADKLLKSRR